MIIIGSTIQPDSARHDAKAPFFPPCTGLRWVFWALMGVLGDLPTGSQRRDDCGRWFREIGVLASGPGGSFV